MNCLVDFRRIGPIVTVVFCYAALLLSPTNDAFAADNQTEKLQQIRDNYLEARRQLKRGMYRLTTDMEMRNPDRNEKLGRIVQLRSIFDRSNSQEYLEVHQENSRGLLTPLELTPQNLKRTRERAAKFQVEHPVRHHYSVRNMESLAIIDYSGSPGQRHRSYGNITLLKPDKNFSRLSSFLSPLSEAKFLSPLMLGLEFGNAQTLESAWERLIRYSVPTAQNKSEVKIEEETDGLKRLEILFHFSYFEPGREVVKFRGRQVLFIDPSRGYSIPRIEIYQNKAEDNLSDSLLMLGTADWVEKNDVWVPVNTSWTRYEGEEVARSCNTHVTWESVNPPAGTFDPSLFTYEELAGVVGQAGVKNRLDVIDSRGEQPRQLGRVNTQGVFIPATLQKTPELPPLPTE
ncbi:MAG: hypothetical protein HUJ26_14535 [Planctomycetaceae bacterium]|nr:hypothetical protein [Planctomycetaceae bacterium]